MDNEKKGYVTVVEAAKIKKVTRQAIYIAIKQNKLRVYKNGKKFKVNLLDLKEYDEQRYSRDTSVCEEGKLIFDTKKGQISVERAAEMIGVPTQKLYYAVRVGWLKATRKKSAWVIDTADLFEYEETYLKKQLSKKKMS